MITKLMLLFACAELLLGCSEAPEDVVIGNGHLEVYSAKERKDVKRGKYEYWIRDNSASGWTLVTDQEFQVGDELQIIKKSK